MIMYAIFLIGGLTNLLFPKQVLAMCEWFGGVCPYGSKGLFADTGENLYRIGGAIIVAITLIVLAVNHGWR